jgi:hypothetical protein
MPKYKKIMLLFLALLFPVLIFLFLKFFGKNEFTVPPLYIVEYPENMNECGVTVELPYRIADSVRTSLTRSAENFTLIYFGELNSASSKNMDKVTEQYKNKIAFEILPDSLSRIKDCVFFLRHPNDLVLVDNHGTIRGHYISGDRDEIDRLRMELSILLKEY